jgi:hypothetical protein
MRTTPIACAAVLAALAFVCACGGSTTGATCTPVSNAAVPHGNPSGYRVHCLTAESLADMQVTINGLSLDTSSADAISSSSAAIVAATDAPTTVEEAPGAPADLSIDFTAPTRRVPDLFYGASLNWYSKYFFKMPNYRALVRNIRMNVLRFPGGQERVRFDRQAHTSPNDQLGTYDAYQYILTGEDVANYIAFCREMGIVAEPEVNIYVDDSAMAVNLVDQIVNELGYDLRCVSVGNEPEVNIYSNWTYLKASSVSEALASYMARYLRYHAAIEKVKPGITYALAETGDWDSNLSSNLDRFLSPLGSDRPGAFSVHWYPTGDYGQGADDPAFPSLNHLVIHNNSHHEITYLSTVAATIRAKLTQYHQDGAKLFMGEWGVAWSASQASSQIEDVMATAIFVAEVQEFCKTLGFDAMEYSGLSDPTSFAPWVPALIGVSGDQVSVRPQYYVYMMYKYFYGDEIVTVPGGQNDLWSIYAAKDAKGSYLMLINRSDCQTITKTVDVTTAAGKRPLRLTLYPHSVSIVSF